MTFYFLLLGARVLHLRSLLSQGSSMSFYFPLLGGATLSASDTPALLPFPERLFDMHSTQFGVSCRDNYAFI